MFYYQERTHAALNFAALLHSVDMLRQFTFKPLCVETRLLTRGLHFNASELAQMSQSDFHFVCDYAKEISGAKPCVPVSDWDEPTSSMRGVR